MIPQTLRSLLTGIVDYAGLFPPAGLDMQEAVGNYADYLRSDTSWMLGRFIVPVARLDEFEKAAHLFFQNTELRAQWRLSVLAGNDFRAEADRILRFNGTHGSPALIDTVETKADSEEQIVRATSFIPQGLRTFFEIPVSENPAGLIASIARAGRGAKVRTGGLTPDMFPLSRDIVRFIVGCIRANVPFKATAGLHHPIRSRYRLTYEENSPVGMMYGFLNLFMTAAFARTGVDEDLLVRLLEEESPEMFHFLEHQIEWRGQTIPENEIVGVRTQLAIAFGSCSFREPVDDLQSLRLL